MTTLDGFSAWEEVQGAFRCGIVLPDGSDANGIGRALDMADFRMRCEVSELEILS